MDFVQDQLATGRKIRVLTMIDTYSRYVPIIDPRFSYLIAFSANQLVLIAVDRTVVINDRTIKIFGKCTYTAIFFC